MGRSYQVQGQLVYVGIDEHKPELEEWHLILGGIRIECFWWNGESRCWLEFEWNICDEMWSLVPCGSDLQGWLNGVTGRA